MSTAAESMQELHETKQKRKYERKKPLPQPDIIIPENPSIMGRPKTAVEQESREEGQEFSCTIPMKYHWETTLSGDKVRKPDFCHNEPKFSPVVTFYGKRREETPPGSKQFIIKTYKFPVRYQPVCEAHMQAIQRDPRVLITGNELNSQAGNMQTIGLPQPSPKLTKISFEPWTPPEGEIDSAHMDALMGNARPEDEDEGVIIDEE